MKIVNKEEFYKLPENILYSNYTNYIISELKIKLNTIYYEGISNSLEEPIDFCYQSLIGNVKCKNSTDFIEILEDAKNNKTFFSLDFYCPERDGLYDDEQLFVIYEPDDVIELIRRLHKTI